MRPDIDIILGWSWISSYDLRFLYPQGRVEGSGARDQVSAPLRPSGGPPDARAGRRGCARRSRGIRVHAAARGMLARGLGCARRPGRPHRQLLPSSLPPRRGAMAACRLGGPWTLWGP